MTFLISASWRQGKKNGAAGLAALEVLMKVALCLCIYTYDAVFSLQYF